LAAGGKQFCDLTAEHIHPKWFAENGVPVEADQLFGVGGHHQNREGRGDLPDPAGDFTAVHSGHEKIQEDDVEGLVSDERQCLNSVPRFGNDMPINAEEEFDGFPRGRVVVDYQYPFSKGYVLLHTNRTG